MKVRQNKMENTNISSQQPLRCIVGAQLSAVVFVQDYVQLQFDGPVITAVTVPTVTEAEVTFRWGMPRYRDMLCERIGKTVCVASVIEGEEVRVEFDDASIISVSLRPENYRAAEAVLFHIGTEDVWVW